jgi:hypothetical protein
MLTCVNINASLYCCIYLMHGLHHNLLDYCNYLMMQSYLRQMVHTRANGDDVLDVSKGSTARGRGCGQPSRGNAPPRPSVSRQQLLATQNELMTLLILNETHRGAEQPQHPRCQDMSTSYSEFLSTHPPLFSGAKDLLEAEDWLHTTESKFDLLHCTEYQKTLYAAQ